MLELKNVSKYYHANEVVALGLRKVNLTFELGEFVAVTGESGSGKSTLLNVISGLDTYEDGEMFVHNEETSYYSVSDWESYRRQYIGFVFQNYNIIDSYSVLENVMIALQIQGYDKEKRKERALELIKRVGLESHTHHKASKLSGGQKQRAVIARALAKDCPIIVADEPTGNLDSESSNTVMSLLREISEDKLVIVVTHNYDEVKEYATRKIRLFDGEVVEDEHIKKHKKVEEQTKIASYIMNTWDLITISFRNLFRTPRRTIFTAGTFLLITAVFTLIYGFFVAVTAEAGGSSYNAIFPNVTDQRIIVTKYDDSVFTQADLDKLRDLNNILGVMEHDIINDTRIQQFSVYVSDYDGSKWLNNQPTYINPAYMIEEIDLTAGRLPESKFEVVIEENSDFNIGDKIYYGFDYIYYDEFNSDLTFDEFLEQNAYEFTVVGTVTTLRQFDWTLMGYFHTNFIKDPDVIQNAYSGDGWDSPFNSRIVINDEGMGLELYNVSYVINDDLQDNEFIVSENYIEQLGWYAQETLGFDIENNPDFYQSIPLTYVSTSTFTNIEFDFTIVDFLEYEDEKFRYDTIEMNQDTFDSIFSIDIYQASVHVKNTFAAEQVQEDIEELGFNAIYPRNVEDPFTAIASIILSVWFGFLMIILMVIIYFLTFMVLRNIQQAKKKDFLILRSIGASKKSLNQVTLIELTINIVVSIVIVFGLLYINSMFKTVKWLVDLLDYYSFGNYLFLFVLLLALSLLLGRRFNSKIFNKSVITSLKAE